MFTVCINQPHNRPTARALELASCQLLIDRLAAGMRDSDMLVLVIRVAFLE
jgi:hypothetical protein